MYEPLQPGIPHKFKKLVFYEETYPNNEGPVYCFWSLQTPKKLKDDFTYLVLPDGCIDIIFDLNENSSLNGAFVMTPNVVAERLNLGKSFSYVGIRLRPGAWLGSPCDIVGGMLKANNLAGYDPSQMRRQIMAVASSKRPALLHKLASELERRGVIGGNPFAKALLYSPTVKDYVVEWGYSRRHLQRIFRHNLGYSPHDFIKITRFQKSLQQQNFASYADQSHYVREFKRITNLTPREFQVIYR